MINAQDRFACWRLSGWRKRFPNRIAGVMLAIVLLSCRIAIAGSAADTATRAVPFPKRIGVRIGSSPSAMAGSLLAETLSYPDAPLNISGWFHIIWNGEPRYTLVDDDGEWIELLIDEQVLRNTGGPRFLDRKRVRVSGFPLETRPEVIQVITINPEDKRGE
ncbi:MAG: hypothetical protein FIA90_08695 [candidate division NC10 bacterium]|nr:hypothetical protein [Candidatus Methylomirabilis sp.]NJD68709.1 hypothetical protein [candidate division NC10 bacterium]